MYQNKTRLAIVAILLLAVVVTFLFSLHNTQQPKPAPTVNVNQIQTQAVSVYIAGQTGTAQTMPTATLTNTPIPTTTGLETEVISPTPSCYRLRFINDISIPDNTRMTSAEVFTKTWLIENNGICAWRAGFKLVLVGGVAMGGSPFTLIQTVNPGGRIEASIKMAAPTNQTGVTQGTWRMSDENGTLFGDFLWVTIDIGDSSTGTPPTPGKTTTP